MSRMRALEMDEVDDDVRALFERDDRLYGVVLNSTRVLAHRPPILAAAKGLSRAVAQDATLPASLRALVCLRVATLIGCPF